MAYIRNTNYQFYNEDLKIEYISYKKGITTLPNKYLERLFNYTRAIEKELDKDVSCFTLPEIEDFYFSMDISSVDSITVMNSHLALYTQFCCEKNLVPDCQNHFLEIERFSKYVSKGNFNDRIISRETLISRISQLPNPGDAVVMLGLFEGIKGEQYEELTNMSIYDLNKKTNILEIGNRNIKISKELAQYIKDSSETYEYYSMTKKMEKVVKLMDEFDGQVIKQYPNIKSEDPFYKGRRIYNKIQRCIDYLGFTGIRGNSLSESGKIYLFNELKTNTDLSEIEIIKEISRIYNCKMNLKVFKDRYEKFLS